MDLAFKICAYQKIDVFNEMRRFQLGHVVFQFFNDPC
jgi:hypothetical protein